MPSSSCEAAGSSAAMGAPENLEGRPVDAARPGLSGGPTVHKETRERMFWKHRGAQPAINAQGGGGEGSPLFSLSGWEWSNSFGPNTCEEGMNPGPKIN